MHTNLMFKMFNVIIIISDKYTVIQYIFSRPNKNVNYSSFTRSAGQIRFTAQGVIKVVPYTSGKI